MYTRSIAAEVVDNRHAHQLSDINADHGYINTSLLERRVAYDDVIMCVTTPACV